MPRSRLGPPVTETLQPVAAGPEPGSDLSTYMIRCSGSLRLRRQQWATDSRDLGGHDPMYRVSMVVGATMCNRQFGSWSSAGACCLLWIGSRRAGLGGARRIRRALRRGRPPAQPRNSAVMPTQASRWVRGRGKPDGHASGLGRIGEAGRPEPGTARPPDRSPTTTAPAAFRGTQPRL